MTDTIHSQYPASTGLIIDEPWISKILNGEKTWEMRARPTKKRGRIALIRKGSGQVVGAATLVDSLAPLTRQQMLDAIYRHCIPADLIDSGSVDSWVYPWVLADVERIDPPLRYDHPSGAVIWVTLDGTGSAGLDTVEEDSAVELPHTKPAVEAPRRAARLNAEASGLTRDAEELLADRFQRIRKPSLYIAGFRTPRGREIAIERTRQQLRIWAEVAPSGLDGMRVVNVSNPGQPYTAGQSRNSNLGSQAPKLSTAHPAVFLEFSDIAAFRDFVEWYQAA